MSTFDPRNDALKSCVELARFSITILEFDNDISRDAMKNNLLRLSGEFVPRFFEINLVVFSNRFKNSQEKTSGRTFPRSNRAGT